MTRRPAQVHRYTVPRRDELLYWLARLASGDVSREAAAEWAGEYVVFDDPELYPVIEDRVVWQALKDLSAADKRMGESQYRYDGRDFKEWARRLSSAP